MRSSSADAPRGRRRTRALLGALLTGALLLGPAVGYAAARFGSTATVTFTITVRSAQADPSAPGAAPATPAPSGASSGP